MKSSTIRRSTLSKESMQVLENLVDSEEVFMNNNNMYDNDGINLPNEYVREKQANSESSIINKAQEIDMLWQSFKNVNFNSQSPTAYILLGFIIGVVTTIIISLCIAPFVNNKEQSSLYKDSAAVESINSEKAEQGNQKIEANLIPDENTNVSTDYSGSPTYTIQDGDTIEKIIIKHYGSYTPERAEAIKKANNLSNLDRISIDQVLIMPKE